MNFKLIQPFPIRVQHPPFSCLVCLSVCASLPGLNSSIAPVIIVRGPMTGLVNELEVYIPALCENGKLVLIVREACTRNKNWAKQAHRVGEGEGYTNIRVDIEKVTNQLDDCLENSLTPADTSIYGLGEDVEVELEYVAVSAEEARRELSIGLS